MLTAIFDSEEDFEELETELEEATVEVDEVVEVEEETDAVGDVQELNEHVFEEEVVAQHLGALVGESPLVTVAHFDKIHLICLGIVLELTAFESIAVFACVQNEALVQILGRFLD